MIPFRRTIQIISLAVFILLLFLSACSFAVMANLDFFLRLDPIIAAGTALSSKTFSLVFLPAVIVLILVPLLGRIFCGYFCPMGTTIDGSDQLFGNGLKDQNQSGKLRTIKYYLLSFLAGSALLGVSFIFTASPISLITRFYGMIVYPVLAFFAEMGLTVIQPLAEKLDLYSIVFAEIPAPRFAAQFFILIFFILIFGAVKISPRFWCRYICPSGALMAILSKKPFIRRIVSEECTDCGKCIKSCPMDAIAQDNPVLTRYEECIVCGTCETVCPVDAVSFSSRSGTDVSDREISLARRRFLYTGFAGAGTAAISLTGINSLYGKPGVGQVAVPGLVRPPGAVPEIDFLARCVRCGECMVACPNNTLQPIWFKSGFTGLFSPSLTPRRGPCSPECNNCGNVCPTEAIRPLPLEERIWAKPGTAEINRQRCLAWEHKKRCMVCDEVCPFGAVEFRIEEGNPVPVPEVTEDKCAGCGYCEHHCPVQNQPAIFVTPMGALRLSEGSYREQGAQQGLDISLKPKDLAESPFVSEDQLYGSAPGFDVSGSEDIVPGLDAEETDGMAPGFVK